MEKYKSDELKNALDWWNSLSIQNLEKPLESWSGYFLKYFPNRNDYCGSLSEEEVLYIWKQEKL